MNPKPNYSALEPVPSPCKLATKFDFAFIISGTKTGRVYITELLALNKLLTNSSTTQ